MTRRTALFLLITLAFASVSSDAFAQSANPSGSLTGLLDLIRNSAASWDGKLKVFAKSLFWSLAVIQLVWTFFPLVMKQADLGEIVGEFIRYIMTIGFFYAILLFSSEWAEAIVNSFRQAGAQAAGLGGVGIRPGDIFDVAVELAKTIGDVETWNPLTAFMLSLSAAIVLLCFTFIAAFMGLTIIESYIVINASVFFMGFGGSQWTREYAMSIIRYTVAVGAKLFVLTLIVGLIIDSAKTWQAAYNGDDASMWTMVGLALTCAYLSKTIPELVSAMISGTSSGGGGAIGSLAATAAALAVGGAAAAAGAMGGGSGGGGGGLADLINSSFSGAGGRPEGASAGPQSEGSSGGTGNMAGSSSPSSSSGSGGGSSTRAGGSKFASGAVRTAGALSAMAVPGMEGAAGLSLDPPPPDNGDDEEGQFESSQTEIPPEMMDDDTNIIRPASDTDTPNDQPPRS